MNLHNEIAACEAALENEQCPKAIAYFQDLIHTYQGMLVENHQPMLWEDEYQPDY